MHSDNQLNGVIIDQCVYELFTDCLQIVQRKFNKFLLFPIQTVLGTRESQ